MPRAKSRWCIRRSKPRSQAASSLCKRGRGAQKARQLIGRIRRTEHAEHVAELVGELKQAIEHHVKEEESEVLPKTREALDTKRLDELGSAFEAAKGS